MFSCRFEIREFHELIRIPASWWPRNTGPRIMQNAKNACLSHTDQNSDPCRNGVFKRKHKWPAQKWLDVSLRHPHLHACIYIYVCVYIYIYTYYITAVKLKHKPLIGNGFSHLFLLLKLGMNWRPDDNPQGERCSSYIFCKKTHWSTNNWLIFLLISYCNIL